MILHRAVKAALLTLCLLVLSPLTVVAQNQPAPTTAPAATSPAPTAFLVPPPAAASPAPTTASNEKLLKPEELDALVAPIALYPDNLLSLMLMASTYPIEIV